jgi:1-phosphatidylinositol-4-phosphate 5-kinase
MREGAGKLYREKRLVYEGEWSKGVKHGWGRLLREGNPVYEGLYNGGYRYSGDWTQGIGAEGVGEQFISITRGEERQDVTVYRGEFKRGQRHGRGTLFFGQLVIDPDGNVSGFAFGDGPE